MEKNIIHTSNRFKQKPKQSDLSEIDNDLFLKQHVYRKFKEENPNRRIVVMNNKKEFDDQARMVYQNTYVSNFANVGFTMFIQALTKDKMRPLFRYSFSLSQLTISCMFDILFGVSDILYIDYQGNVQDSLWKTNKYSNFTYFHQSIQQDEIDQFLRYQNMKDDKTQFNNNKEEIQLKFNDLVRDQKEKIKL